ncbi:MAG: hypothetical protein AAGA77_10950 [Bacteroidota bacterium]
MLVFILATFMYFLIIGGGNTLSMVGYIQAFGFSLMTLIALIALSCIPVLIYCYFVKMIPDIDYSIRLAFVITILGIISELIF